MITLRHQIESTSSKQKACNFRGAEDKTEQGFSVSQVLLASKKRVAAKLSFLKRLSPFLMIIPCLMILFFYRLISETGPFHGGWVLFILYPFIIVNLLLADFSLWNYFGGKRKLIIWLTELATCLIILHLLT